MIKTVTMNPAIDKTVEIVNFRVGAVNRISSLRLDAGGKGINVSKTIKALNGSSLATGILAGKTGEYIKNYLDQMGVDNDFIFVNGETRTNVKVVDRLNHTNTDINEPGIIDIAQEDLSLLEKSIFDPMGKDDILVLSGSVPSNVSSAIYREWTERAVKSGIRVLIDADGELLREGRKARPYIIKPNINELERLLNRKLANVDEVASAAKSLLDTGIEIIAVSLGADGAVFVKRDQTIYAEGLSVDVRSTVGAGDAMVASLALAFTRDFTFEEAVTLSIATAAANVASSGTLPPKLEDVRSYESQVRLNYLK
jgi:1-phosphofructokinase